MTTGSADFRSTHELADRGAHPPARGTCRTDRRGSCINDVFDSDEERDEFLAFIVEQCHANLV